MSELNNENKNTLLICQAKQSDFDKLYTLFQSGELDNLLGNSVVDMGVISDEEISLKSSEIRINFSQWLSDIFETGWHKAEELLSLQQLQLAHFSEQVKRAKKLDLVIDLITHSVVLVVNIDRETSEKIVITLQVYPTDGNRILPQGLKLTVLAEGKVFEEVTARNADQLIQCRFDAEIGDQFTLELRLGDAIMREDFIF